MKDLRTHSAPLLIALLALLLGACAPLATRPTGTGQGEPPARGEPGRYEATRDAATVAELRAAPAPDHAEVVDSQSPAGDERVLGAKGFVRIGDGYYGGDPEKARGWLTARAREVGADRVLIYAESADGASQLHAAYYVHFKLPFGASFRDLRADERDAAAGGGVVIGDVIGNSPASDALLLKGDIVIAVAGTPVRDRKQFQELLRQHMGKRVNMNLLRDGTQVTRSVRLGVLAVGADGK